MTHIERQEFLEKTAVLMYLNAARERLEGLGRAHGMRGRWLKIYDDLSTTVVQLVVEMAGGGDA